MEELDNLNLKYEFCSVKNLNINISVDSVKKLSDFNITKAINEMVNLNEEGLKVQLQNTLINRKNYVSYSEEYDLILNKLKQEYSNDILSPIKIIFLKLKKKRPRLNFKLNVLVSYRSPAGRNYYERKFNYNYDNLVEIVSNYGKSDFNYYTQCIQCKELINIDAKYCCHCGKSQNGNDTDSSNKSGQTNVNNDNLSSVDEVVQE